MKRRSGFTLVELLAVVVVITILVAMLLPAIGSVRNKAREAQVAVEIRGFVSSITTFNHEFGANPPSRFRLYEHTNGWFSDQPAMTEVRRLWPQFDFGNPSSSPPRILTWDLNGDGSSMAGDSHELTGAECLVFFLGGRGVLSDGVARGFSRNPRNPFEPTGGTPIGPFFKFDPDKFVDVDGDGAREYADPLATGTPYLYLSSYNGRGYQPNIDADVKLPHATWTASPPATRPDLGVDSNGDSVVDTGQPYMQSSDVPWLSDTFQIISAGSDGMYGAGGIYGTESGLAVGSGFGDADNITNFTSGKLLP